jgi:hypothetical protein
LNQGPSELQSLALPLSYKRSNLKKILVILLVG